MSSIWVKTLDNSNIISSANNHLYPEYSSYFDNYEFDYSYYERSFDRTTFKESSCAFFDESAEKFTNGDRTNNVTSNSQGVNISPFFRPLSDA